MNLSNDILKRLSYSLKVYLKDSSFLEIDIASVRGQGPVPLVAIHSPISGLIRLGSNIKSEAADSMLELAVPLPPIQKYLAAGPLSAEICVANGTENGWVTNMTTGASMIDFLN
ncbi:MAG: hypothetical protein ABSG21_10510 [Spirochaetia bacterium]|jgi:hypothetical protein